MQNVSSSWGSFLHSALLYFIAISILKLLPCHCLLETIDILCFLFAPLNHPLLPYLLPFFASKKFQSNMVSSGHHNHLQLFIFALVRMRYNCRDVSKHSHMENNTIFYTIIGIICICSFYICISTHETSCQNTGIWKTRKTYTIIFFLESVHPPCSPTYIYVM